MSFGLESNVSRVGLNGDAPLHSSDARAGGLSSEEAERLLRDRGPNELPEDEARTPWRAFVAQLSNLMIQVLLVAAGISVVLGELQDALVILVIIVLNTIIGAVQELRAEHAVKALRVMAAPTARVLRDGAWVDVPSREVVPGDTLRLEAGDVVSADGRLTSATDLQADEASLTGESHPVSKDPSKEDSEGLPLGDRVAMVFSGTLVTRGHGEAVVAHTGPSTQVGRVGHLLVTEERALTPLQRRLDRFGKHVAWIVLAVCVVFFLVGIARDLPTPLLLLTAVSLGVAAIPEALPAVVSVALALGARRMGARNALVRRLPAVETLGSVTYACTDKTGTLTEGRMAVVGALVGEERLEGVPTRGSREGAWEQLGLAMTLVNDAHDQVGDPTEVALLNAARASGFEGDFEARTRDRVGDVPFHADRRRMSTVHRDAEGFVIYAKGAPEAILERCVDGDTVGLLDRAEVMAREGLRVMAFATRHLDALPQLISEATVENDLVLLGFVALMDPPRAGAQEAIQQCRAAGVTPVMITGDHPETGAAIARRLGILQDGDGVLSGVELARLTDQELAERVETIRVHARVSPEQKIRIVRALQERGEFVAMTGDGVNDAPALKRAEIGVAMGRTGTSVAREAADMVLLDDDFSTIVVAIREGRRVYGNVRKFVKYVMTGNAGEVLTVLLAPMFGLPLPLLPIHILWVNLVTDGLPGLALGVEPAEKDVMRRPPRRPDETLFAHGLGRHVIWCGMLIAALSLGTQAWAIGAGSDAWQTAVFTVLTLCQLVHVMAIRSETESILTQGLLSNRPMLLAVLATAALQLAVIYAPPLQRIFHTQSLSLGELLVCIALPATVLVAVEFEKWLLRRGFLGGGAR